MAKAETKKSRLQELLALSPDPVSVQDFERFAQALTPISPSYLRRLLRESGKPLSPLVEGVRTNSIDELSRSLLALLNEYDQGARGETRQAVIEAKDHARLAQIRKPTPERAEAILWMHTWLENPGVFREWAAIRRAIAARLTPP